VPNGRLDGGDIARLIEAAATVAGQPDLKAVLRATIETAMDLTEAPYGALGVLGEHGMLAEFIHEGIGDDLAKDIGRLPEGKGLLGTITRLGKTIRLENIADHPDSDGFPDRHPHMTSFLGVPIRVGAETFGNLYLADKKDGFTSDDAELVEALALIAGSAVSTARLQGRIRHIALVEDRERIAREIHDGVIQNLFAIGLGLQSAAAGAEPELAAHLDEAVNGIDESMATLRRYIFDIKAPMREARSLEAELRHVCDVVVDPDATCTVQVSGSFRDLSADMVNEAVQLAREALSNANRHAAAAHINVDATRRGDWLVIVVSDDGAGFDVETTATGMGLGNMHRRAERLGGRVEVTSKVGSGTLVRAEIPTR